MVLGGLAALAVVGLGVNGWFDRTEPPAAMQLASASIFPTPIPVVSAPAAPTGPYLPSVAPLLVSPRSRGPETAVVPEVSRAPHPAPHEDRAIAQAPRVRKESRARSKPAADGERALSPVEPRSSEIAPADFGPIDEVKNPFGAGVAQSPTP